MKKPNTAGARSRKQVHYNLGAGLQVETEPASNEDAQMKQIMNSSYFKNDYEISNGPKLMLSARPQHNVKLYSKLKTGMIVSVNVV